MLPGPKDPGMAEKDVKKTGVTPLGGLMDPYTSEERGLKFTGSKGPTCGV